MTDILKQIDEADEAQRLRFRVPTKISGLSLLNNVPYEDGSHYLDKFPATYSDLVKILGEPNGGPSGDGKVDIEWGITYKGHRGYIYDWKEYESPKENPYDKYWWHIGGNNNLGLWTSDLIKAIDKATESNQDDADSEQTNNTIQTVEGLREWFDNSKKDVRHLVEQYYYEDLYNLDKDQLCDWLVENKDELEDIMKDDDIVIDITAIRNHTDLLDNADLVLFDNFYLEGQLSGVIDIEDELLSTPDEEVEEVPTKHIECSADYIGSCDLSKVHDGNSIWGAELKIRCDHAIFSVKDGGRYIAGDYVDLDKLSYLVECAVSNGQAQFALTDSFVKHPELRLTIDLDDCDVITMILTIIVDEPEIVDEINNAEPYDSEEDDFNVICDNGDCFTYHTYEEAVDKAKQFANTWKVEKVSYGVKNNEGDFTEREFIKREDVWVPGDGRVATEKTIYEELEDLD